MPELETLLALPIDYLSFTGPKYVWSEVLMFAKRSVPMRGTKQKLTGGKSSPLPIYITLVSGNSLIEMDTLYYHSQCL